MTGRMDLKHGLNRTCRMDNIEIRFIGSVENFSDIPLNMKHDVEEETNHIFNGCHHVQCVNFWFDDILLDQIKLS